MSGFPQPPPSLQGSALLDRVKNFLPQIAQANKELEEKVRRNEPIPVIDTTMFEADSNGEVVQDENGSASTEKVQEVVESEKFGANVDTSADHRRLAEDQIFVRASPSAASEIAKNGQGEAVKTWAVQSSSNRSGDNVEVIGERTDGDSSKEGEDKGSEECPVIELNFAIGDFDSSVIAQLEEQQEEDGCSGDEESEED